MRYCGNCGFDMTGLAISSPETSRNHLPEGKPRGTRGTPMLAAALIVAVGLVGYGLLTRPGAGTPPGASPGAAPGGVVSLAPGATPIPSGPIVGLTIQSPRDGEQVFTKEVTVIGLAPPGLRITRDISLRPDQHATADSTGHWAIAVDLEQGDNTLVFRIGDDRSTEQRLRLTYTPPTS
jgi:hypothetical protein